MAVSRRINTGNGFVLATCQTTDTEGDCVYVTSEPVAGKIVVTKVEPQDLTKGPAIGLIRAKTSTTDCVIQVTGILDSVYTGLTPQSVLFVGIDGRLQSTTAGINPPSGGKVFVQQFAIALGSSKILIAPQAPIIRID